MNDEPKLQIKDVVRLRHGTDNKVAVIEKIEDNGTARLVNPLNGLRHYPIESLEAIPHPSFKGNLKNEYA